MRYERLLEVRNSLSHLDECVDACVSAWRDGACFGTYNVTNSGSITTGEVVELIRRSGVLEKEFTFFESEEEFMREAAKTPRSHCVLDNSKSISAGMRLSHVADAIEHTLLQMRLGRASASPLPAIA
jgi:UDP-glucose 4,6-dehydratase